MGRGVTDTGSQRPSGRRRRPSNRAWRRARPGFGEATLSLLWSVLGHIIVVGALILHFTGRTPDIPGIEIFAAEPLAETEQLPLKEVAQADTPAPRRPSPIRLNISARGPESGPPSGPHKTRPASAPSAPVADAGAHSIRGEPASVSTEPAAASISSSDDHARLQDAPDAEPAPATSSRIVPGDVETTASVVGGQGVAGGAAASVGPPPVPVPQEMTASVPPMTALEPSPGGVRALMAAEVPSPALPRIESLAPPSVPSSSESTAPGSEPEPTTQPAQPAPRPSTAPLAVPRPRGGTGIILTSPREGLQLTRDDPPVVVVEGEVEDASVSTVVLAANGLRVAVPVHAGRFRRALPILEPLVRLRVEASVNGTSRQSSTVTVHSTAGAQFGVIVFDWPTVGDGPDVEVSATWRATPERLDGPTHTAVMKTIAGVDGRPGDAFYLRMLKPGVYTFVLRSRKAVATEEIRSTFYFPAAGAVAQRDLEPFSLSGIGRRVMARVLLPYGVFWDQDEWFSGRSESIDTVLKFRFPEGISWVEGKTGPR